MMNFLLTTMFRKIFFLTILCLSLLSIIALPLFSLYYHQRNDMPKIRQGVIDLTDFTSVKEESIPLDGQWEFYRDQWIISDKPPLTAGEFVQVPQPWVRYQIAGGPLPSKGKGSYRIMIKNCPANIDLLSYIPNISSRYRVYLNGGLVASRSDMDIKASQAEKKDAYKVNYGSIRLEKPTDAELVIELLSPHIGGLYLTPILADKESDQLYRNSRHIFAAVFIGILSITIAYIFCIWLLRDKSLRVAALLLLDLLVCVRILVRDEFFEVTQQIIPVFRYYLVNSTLQILVVFLPIIFLFCVKQLIGHNINKKMIISTAIYEVLLSVFMLYCAYAGLPDVQFFLCLASYIPFIPISFHLYCGVAQGKPYVLSVFIILMLTITSLLISALNDFGFLIFNVSLLGPGCFVIAVILQLILYIRHNLQLQQQAIEVENLRLKLRDNQVSLMLSQIQPHFVYNTLTAIHMLCLEAPSLAADTVMKFAVFLRTNIRFINTRSPIAFAQEFLHIQNFVEIEKLRFQKRLQILYDIQTTDFFIPALSIQPLVENAIRHGATKNITGGTVILRSYENGNFYGIEIIDDGPGFDPAILNEEGNQSFGLHNIIFRLREQMHAKIEFISKIDQGTTVRILLPKEKEHENNHH